jgi:hypothetical protein
MKVEYWSTKVKQSVLFMFSGTLSNCFPGSEMDGLKQKIMEYEALRTTAYDANNSTVFLKT